MGRAKSGAVDDSTVAIPTPANVMPATNMAELAAVRAPRMPIRSPAVRAWAGRLRVVPRAHGVSQRIAAAIGPASEK
jgi:hypothetical protein